MGIITAATALTVGAIAAGTAATASVVGGAIQSGQEHKAMRTARTAKEAAAFKVKELQDARQDIINPFAGVTDLSSMAKDLTGMMSNPFESLGVATKAAEMQAEEADISLANTLDLLRATGASAGGATALVQAALASKKGVSASIEQQEATNQKLRAQGQAALTQAKVNEQQRLQGVAISEGQRTQQADAQGKLFEFNAQEDRDNSDISYNIAKETGGAQREAAARARRDDATAGIFTGLGSVASGVASSAFTAGLSGNLPTTKTPPPPPPPQKSSGAGMPSDRRLKKNIKLIGFSKSGLNIYAFEYIDKAFGTGVWQGVMSDEAPKSAVIKHKDGYDWVNYSKLDVTFKQI